MRAMVAARTVAGNNEGNGNKDEGGKQQIGQGRQGNGNGDKGGRQATAMVFMLMPYFFAAQPD